jgi:hypothetical protein
MAEGDGPSQHGGHRPSQMDSERLRGKSDDRSFDRDHTVRLDVLDNTHIRANSVIEAIEKKAGPGSVFACVPKSGNLFEVTAADNTTAELLLDGIDIEGKVYACTEVSQTRGRPITVSIMHLPAYIEDNVIVSVLTNFDSEIELIGSVRRHYYRGTSIADGTRLVTLKLPPTCRSLPYTMKFPFESSSEYYRVMHDNQVKLCRVCYSHEHVMMSCPDFLCNKCGCQGHFKRQCVAKQCVQCYRYGAKCMCDLCVKCDKTETECNCVWQCESCGGKSEECYCSDDEMDINKLGSDNTSSDKPTVNGEQVIGESRSVTTVDDQQTAGVSTQRTDSETSKVTTANDELTAGVKICTDNVNTNHSSLTASTVIGATEASEGDIRISACVDSAIVKPKAMGFGRPPGQPPDSRNTEIDSDMTSSQPFRRKRLVTRPNIDNLKIKVTRADVE